MTGIDVTPGSVVISVVESETAVGTSAAALSCSTVTAFNATGGMLQRR